jgi:hypothetical protein
LLGWNNWTGNRSGIIFWGIKWFTISDSEIEKDKFEKYRCIMGLGLSFRQIIIKNQG